MIIGRQEDVTAAAASVMERTSDPRLREIMLSLVKHLHGFVRDVRLTEAEFREATAILAELGRQSTDTHNEVVLMAGSLGVSSLVCLLNNGDQGNTETAQSLLGPFWRLNLPGPNAGAHSARMVAGKAGSSAASGLCPAELGDTPDRETMTAMRKINGKLSASRRGTPGLSKVERQTR
jgi:hypothetical protein